MSEVAELWQDKSALPDIGGLSQPLAAELILRCGSVFGFLGHNKQIPNSQEKSRNLLSNARNLFIELYDMEKVAECENYLALTYSRKGELKEADAWLDEALFHDLRLTNDTRIYSYVLKGLVLFSTQNYKKLLELLVPLESYVLKSSDACLIGAFYNQIGNAWERLNNIPSALRALESAKDFYQKAHHQVYYGAILNDLSYLLMTDGNFVKAHKMIDTATEAFKKIKDRSREGFSLDTKATIYQAEGNYSEAVKTIEKAVEILKLGENYEYIVATLRTKLKILISMNDISSATFCLIEAVEIAKTQISEDMANSLVKDFEAGVRERLTSRNYVSTGENESVESAKVESFAEEFTSELDRLELVLPSSLSNYQEIQGIWINNSHLENVGLVRDSLAIVTTTEKVERGDLIAIEEKENQQVSCGFYDNEFGIICLESHNSEPLLFDEESITVIGKIVGVALERTADGKMIVEPISL